MTTTPPVSVVEALEDAARALEVTAQWARDAIGFKGTAEAILKDANKARAALPLAEQQAEFMVLAERVCKEALPKFNWGQSALDGGAIELLNKFMFECERRAAKEPNP